MNTGRNMRHACIYARVSTVEQEKEGFSIPAQLKMLRSYAKKHGFNIVHEYVDSETARSTGRTGFNTMLAYMGKHTECNVILVEKTDRLTRNMADYLEIDIEKSGIEIHFVREGKVMSRNSSPSDHFIQDIEIAQAAYLSRNISSEARKGMKAKAEAGLYPSFAPLGYLNTDNENGVKIIIPDPVNAPLVTQMFQIYAEGNTSIKEIASKLYSLGLRTKKGNRVSNSTIHKMLRNPVYRGKFLWNGIEYDGKHESIVTSSLWFAVQDMLGERSVEKPKQYHEFAYTGFMKCGICGCAITAERKKNKYSYYHCTGHKGWHHGEPSIREVKLDLQFSAFLRKLRIEEGIIPLLLEWLEKDTRDERKTLKEILTRFTSQRKRLQSRSEVLYDDRLDGRITLTRFDLKDAENRREIELIDEKLASLEASAILDPLTRAKGILELNQSAGRLFVKAPNAEKKPFLENLLSNCTLESGSIKPELQYPFDLLQDTNIAWKASGAVSSDISAVRSFWHPKPNSNSSHEWKSNMSTRG
ncbi:MAG: recombinase family protein [Candidatus Sabulitectum sp.]|nr:recombinase family protein [Candidatus Sabulitectum sp.]